MRFSKESTGGSVLRAAAVLALVFIITGAARVLWGVFHGQKSQVELPQPYSIRASATSTLSADQLDILRVDLERQGEGAVAIRYAYAVAAAENDVSNWKRLEQAYQARADWAAMQDTLRHVLALEPQDAQAHFDLALLLLPYNQREAYQHLEQAALDPGLAEMGLQLQALVAEIELLPQSRRLARIGQALAALQNWAQAEQAFSMSAELEADFAEAWAYLALMRAEQGKPTDEAIVRAQTLAPNDGLVNLLIGMAWHAQGSTEHALAALSYAQTLDPLNPVYALELGTLYRELGDLASAEYWLRYAYEMTAEDVSFLRLLALFYAEELYNLDADGIVILSEAVQMLPLDPDLQAAYGWALFNSGDMRSAQEALTTALSLDPNSPRGLYYQGLVFQAQGQIDAARSAFAQVVALDEPEGFEQLARRALQQLE